MIQHGGVCVYDKNYEYMYDLQESSFFGEYNIMFGLYSSLHYKGKSKKYSAVKQRNVIYKIPGKDFMSIICDDVQMFKHFHDISL